MSGGIPSAGMILGALSERISTQSSAGSNNAKIFYKHLSPFLASYFFRHANVANWHENVAHYSSLNSQSNEYKMYY